MYFKTPSLYVRAFLVILILIKLSILLEQFLYIFAKDMPNIRRASTLSNRKLIILSYKKYSVDII